MATADGGDQAPSLAVVERTGPLCTVQDLGRTHGRRVGVGPGGAMDQGACLWANRLLDNDPRAALLEVTLGGLAVRFEADAVVALTGAECAATLNGSPVSTWRTTEVRSGQLLRFGYTATGMRGYLALPGGLETKRAFGSASTVIREGLPGLLGRPLRAGDELHWEKPGRLIMPRSVPWRFIPGNPSGGTEGRTAECVALPLLLGYEWDQFSEADRRKLLNSEWSVDPASNRTATQLVGPALRSGPRVLDSTPLVDGTVQVTGAGRPLVFMRDRPTIGGYAKLGSVAPVALDSLAQVRPGTSVRFVLGDPAEARRAMARREAFFGVTAPLARGPS